VPGALFDSSFAIATTAQPNITQIGTTASIKIPTGTTAQRGTPLAGGIRYNTTLGSFEGYSGSNWGSLGGLIDIDQDTYITAEATIDKDSLDFWTAGVQQMSIDSAGIVSLFSTASIKVPTGTTAQQGTATTGAFRFNTTDTNFEGYDGSAWKAVKGVTGINDNSTSVAITIDSSENVGIGIANPGAYKLYVNGDIYCDDISTSDIKMCNDRPNHPGNEIDGTKGSWTFQEGSENMYLINRKSGKRYKLKLEEV
jgi:hypothetical protein